MKRITALLTLFLTIQFVIAADSQAALSTATPLVGALEALSETNMGSFHAIYLPGYGLQISGFVNPSLPEESQVVPITDSIVGVLQGLAGTIRGLEEVDWVSIGATIFSNHDVVVRIRPNNAGSLEVFDNGEKR